MSFVSSQQRGFPSHWEILAFEDAFVDMTGGNTKVQTRDYQRTGTLPVIDQGQAPVAGYVDDPMLACRAPLPCILFGDHTRIFKYAEQTFALGADGVKVLVPGPGIDARFAFHYLRTVRLPEDLGYSRHFRHLREAVVPRPPLAEQRRIAAMLDKADAIRRKRKEAIALTEELLRSTFLDMFGDPVTNPKGWPVKPLGSLLGFLTSGSRGWAQYYADSGETFLRIQNVRKDFLDLSDVAFVCAPDTAEAKRTQTRPGDVLLSITADLGRTAVVPPTLERAFINQHLAILRPHGVDSEYLSAFLASEGGQLQFSRRNKGGVKAGLNFDDIRSVEVVLPPDAAQTKWAIVKQRIRETIANMGLALNHDEHLFNALVARAFSGSPVAYADLPRD